MGREKHVDESHPDIIQDECKGCGRGGLRYHAFGFSMNGKGYVPAVYIGEGCNGCGICFYNCPEPYAIVVYKKDKE